MIVALDRNRLEILDRDACRHLLGLQVLGRIGVTVTFLAILELIKETLIDVVQTEAFGPIHIRAAQAGPGPSEVSEERVQQSGTDDQYNG